jgi:hypothetical protein
VFFGRTRSFALRFLLANSHNRFDAAHGNATFGNRVSCMEQLSNGAIEVPFRSHRIDFKILFDEKIFLNRTGTTRDTSEHIFDNHDTILVGHNQGRSNLLKYCTNSGTHCILPVMGAWLRWRLAALFRGWMKSRLNC